MITSIHDGSKLIIQYLLEKAVKYGNFNHVVEVRDNELAEKLDFDKSKRFVVCIQYLVAKGLIESKKSEEIRYIKLTADAVDFLVEN